MGLDFRYLKGNDTVEMYEVKERLALTEDAERLVPEESPEARWLYAVPGQKIPMEEAEKFGLLSGSGDAPAAPAEEPAESEPEVEPAAPAEEAAPAPKKRSKK